MKEKKNVLMIALLVAVVAMSVGYAALAQTLTINGTANISADWDVQITGITEGALNGATVVGTPAFDATSATFEVDLAYPGASAVFDVTVENKGTIDAVLDSIGGLVEANSAEPTYITYTVTGVEENDELAANGKVTATVTVSWDSAQDTVPEDAVSKTATITLNYVQAN